MKDIILWLKVILFGQLVKLLLKISHLLELLSNKLKMIIKRALS